MVGCDLVQSREACYRDGSPKHDLLIGVCQYGILHVHFSPPKFPPVRQVSHTAEDIVVHSPEQAFWKPFAQVGEGYSAVEDLLVRFSEQLLWQTFGQVGE